MSTSNVYARGWVPHTCIAMASTIRVSSYDESGIARQVGLIQSFKPTDARKMERARGIGYGDRVAEIVPGLTDTSITCSRMALYQSGIMSVFGYSTEWNKPNTQGTVRTLAHHKNPFDISEVVWFHGSAGGSSPGGGSSVPTQYTVTFYHDCWLSNYSKTIEITGNLILVEDVTIDVTWVSDGTAPEPYASTDAIPGMHGYCGPNGTSSGTAFNAKALVGSAGTTLGS